MLFSQGSNYDRAFRICIFAVDGVGFPLRLDWLVLMVCLPTVSRGWTAGSEDMASSCICIQTNKAAFNSFPQKNSVFFMAFLHFYHDNHVSFRAFTLYKTMIFCWFQPFFCKNHILFNEFQPFYWEYPSFLSYGHEIFAHGKHPLTLNSLLKSVFFSGQLFLKTRVLFWVHTFFFCNRFFIINIKLTQQCLGSVVPLAMLSSNNYAKYKVHLTILNYHLEPPKK